jgi:hypothetical protein
MISLRIALHKTLLKGNPINTLNHVGKSGDESVMPDSILKCLLWWVFEVKVDRP